MSWVGQSRTFSDGAVGDVLLEAVNAEVDELAALAVHGVLGHHANRAVVAEERGGRALGQADVLKVAAEP
jgi:hypothetical protein